jgi:glycosyltransferase involved in cell wall biosynthesis
VIIPTHGRPRALLEALRSVACQTLPPLETIVIVDGPDPATRAVLGRPPLPVRVVELERPTGAAQARNAGIAAARGEWIALLDDDDEWLPGKLERQVAALAALGDGPWILSCRVECRAGRRSSTLPGRLPAPDEPLGDYLFVHAARDGHSGLAQTSTLLAPRAVFERVGFDPWLRRHQDPDWLLRAADVTGARLHLVWEPLVVWHVGGHPRISSHADWRHALEFAGRRRELLSRRAYSSFLLSQVARQAKEQGDVLAQIRILGRALADGAPTAADVAWFAARALVPSDLKPWGRLVWAKVTRSRTDAL